MNQEIAEAMRKLKQQFNDGLDEFGALACRSSVVEKSANVFKINLRQVRKIAQAGCAAIVFKAGDVIVSQKANGDEIEWIVIDVQNHCVKLDLLYLLDEKMAFGESNDWESSEIRAWLNDEKKGFLSWFSQKERESIAPTEIVTCCDGEGKATIDKVFLLSRSEVGLGNEGGVHEGDVLQFFKDDASRVKRFKNGIATYRWLRSPRAGSAYRVRLVTTSGAVDSITACSTCAVEAACSIR